VNPLVLKVPKVKPTVPEENNRSPQVNPKVRNPRKVVMLKEKVSPKVKVKVSPKVKVKVSQRVKVREVKEKRNSPKKSLKPFPSKINAISLVKELRRLKVRTRWLLLLSAPDASSSGELGKLKLVTKILTLKRSAPKSENTFLNMKRKRMVKTVVRDQMVREKVKMMRMMRKKVDPKEDPKVDLKTVKTMKRMKVKEDLKVDPSKVVKKEKDLKAERKVMRNPRVPEDPDLNPSCPSEKERKRVKRPMVTRPRRLRKPRRARRLPRPNEDPTFLQFPYSCLKMGHC